MERKEENVYENIAFTEDGAAAQTGNGGGANPKDASTDLGKFKDVNALLKAYGSLQAEFTRRSQRLKELERQAEKRKNVHTESTSAKAESVEKTSESVGTGAEKLRSLAKERRAEEQRFDAFVQELEATALNESGKQTVNESVVSEAESVCAEGSPARLEYGDNVEKVGVKETAQGGEAEASTEAETDVKTEVKADVETKAEEVVRQEKEKRVGEERYTGSAFEAEEGQAGTSVADSRKHIQSEELFRLASGDESVRLRIIGEYLTSVGKSGAPLMRGGVGICAAPVSRAKTIGEAGDMALRFFQKGSLEK